MSEKEVSGGVETKPDAKSVEPNLAPKEPEPNKPGKVPRPCFFPKRYGAPCVIPKKTMIEMKQLLEKNK